ncbi:tRNA 5-methylaminomethyl-2-thiouridine synthase (plasmid) [Bradyrhizobium sp. 183]|uniref:DUF6894 family protein n=1 Tax=unclassified Bradyrhizobium TaxID=2631580 RepID=UPI001FF87B45|nr:MULTISPECIES: tRNA 5-methylaminomethyl-2-thiouridine synthase [unclassified Bradyrhizobium]MCK1568230.1 tRNA 5-methylaminomethyl-2-thiouridine synthase [Bradyrhizobium sp. 173]UPJ84617.1 tRNA 5-methylaminomethyl-2-thiouridine synthase [Bradyrhizobium sp. 184]UPJ92458.1 tRNA 5-methylaminomethyl-2-thiouridine synthase [Bradyrhizobium sp. 183]
MTRYFFNVAGSHPFQDTLGEELLDDNAAWQAALDIARHIAASLTPGDGCRLEVMNLGRLIHSIEITTQAFHTPALVDLSH